MSPTFSSLNLVLLGPPGAGTGTQAERLASRFSIPHVSPDGMADGDGGNGRRSSERLLEGRVLQRLHRDDCARGFLLDGYPRTVEQANRLDGVLAELGRGLERVIELRVPDEVARTRLAAAGDDAPEDRIAAYRERATELFELYRERGLLQSVDGSGPPDEVTATLLNVVAAPVGA